MALLALGSSDSSTTTTSQTSTASLDSRIPTSTNPEVNRIFSERTEEYTGRLKLWSEARQGLDSSRVSSAELQKLIDELDSIKPQPPVFEKREWVTIDGEHKTQAILFDTDDKTVSLVNQNNFKSITLPKTELNIDSRLYIEDAYKKLVQYRQQQIAWEEKREGLVSKLSLLQANIDLAEEPEPSKPSFEAVEKLVAEREAKQESRERIAREEARRKSEKAAAARAEYEYDRDGLVLLKKTVRGISGLYAAKITGTIENRRLRKLSYVEISYHLYDESDALVGTARANITGLEPGTKWKFEAVSVKKDFETFKLNELRGF